MLKNLFDQAGSKQSGPQLLYTVATATVVDTATVTDGETIPALTSQKLLNLAFSNSCDITIKRKNGIKFADAERDAKRSLYVFQPSACGSQPTQIQTSRSAAVSHALHPI